jgi:osmoprotectant transport system permease protein
VAAYAAGLHLAVFGTLLTGALLVVTLRWPATAQPLIYLCGVIFTIPSLALFILLLPFTGLSLTTSVIGLTIYSLLILLRNVIAGIENCPPPCWSRRARSATPAIPVYGY